MISFSSRGDWKRTDSFLKSMLKLNFAQRLEKFGRQGVAALSRATAVDSGISADSWDYEIRSSRGSSEIIFTNSHVTSTGVPIVILLQYGHGTGNGGYVQGRDFINPAIKPIFDKIAADAWKAVTTS